MDAPDAPCSMLLTDGPTNRQTLIYRCKDASKNVRANFRPVNRKLGLKGGEDDLTSLFMFCSCFFGGDDGPTAPPFITSLLSSSCSTSCFDDFFD